MIRIGSAAVAPVNVQAIELVRHVEFRPRPRTGVIAIAFGTQDEQYTTYELQVHVVTSGIGSVQMRAVASDDEAAIVREIEQHASAIKLWRVGSWWVPRSTITGFHAYQRREPVFSSSSSATPGVIEHVIYCVFSHLGNREVAREATATAAQAFITDALARLEA